MIDYSKAVMKKRIDKTIAALEANNMKGYRVSSREEMFDVLGSLIVPGITVGFGGSMTLVDAGIIDWLRWKDNINLLDRSRVDDKDECMRQCMSSDVYFSSSNAITEDGWLYNVDGRGSRVAPMIFGPKSVVIVVGCNKLVPDLAAAQQRVKSIAAPANAMRLDCETPCAKSGMCTNCKSPDRICRDYVAMGPQMEKNRIKVVFLEESIGY